MGRMDDKVALITGAAQGIGAVYARALAAEGAKVVVTDRLDGEGVAQLIRGAGGDALFFKGDVTSEADVARVVEEAEQAYGRIDVLVSNAAIFGTLEMKRFLDIDVDEWRRVIDVNVTGAFLYARAVAPLMIKNGYGRIINISSGTAFKGTPNFLHYVTSKGAILSLTRSLADELGAYGICVNTLAPGLVLSASVKANERMQNQLTEKVLQGRAIKRDQQPEDLIGPLLFLASDDCQFMTGQAVVVDGGSVKH